MTRASSSSNKLRFSQKEYLTHRKVPLAVMTLAMFMADIIVPVMFISDVNHANIWQNVNKNFSSDNFIWTLVVLFLGIYLGVDSFHYLHVEKQVDFYESQPLIRKQRFFGIVLNSVLAYVALSAIFMLLGILETAGMTGRGGSNLYKPAILRTAGGSCVQNREMDDGGIKHYNMHEMCRNVLQCILQCSLTRINRKSFAFPPRFEYN